MEGGREGRGGEDGGREGREGRGGEGRGGEDGGREGGEGGTVYSAKRVLLCFRFVRRNIPKHTCRVREGAVFSTDTEHIEKSYRIQASQIAWCPTYTQYRPARKNCLIA